MLKHVLAVIDRLDDPAASGRSLAQFLDAAAGPAGSGAEIVTVRGGKGSTDFVRVRVPGRRGRAAGGDAPTLGIVGRARRRRRPPRGPRVQVTATARPRSRRRPSCWRCATGATSSTATS
ncbi:DUF1177 family protein [Actinomadura sp. CNU-125]|uniref:DUF1177 family protein n=1 Tax=Actinomadura sp. CNU-125 TaxID=1904961 RepID=UPI0021CC818C|nr:DUF1177 family protein [Actinomadura sp. CNU-125]